MMANIELMTKKRSYIDEFIALPDEEKDRIVAQYDREFIVDEFKPFTRAQLVARGLELALAKLAS